MTLLWLLRKELENLDQLQLLLLPAQQDLFCHLFLPHQRQGQGCHRLLLFRQSRSFAVW
jgi:hypothetical protein